jgi:hypothetical protein
MSYGITTETLPMDSEGNAHDIFLTDYLEDQQNKEEERKSMIDEKILFPLKYDVLLGRGRPYQEFPGNVKMADIIDSYREAYQGGKKVDKTALSNKVLQIVKKSNGRFLKKSDSNEAVWIEVSDNLARDKVSHGFRTKTRKKTGAKQMDTDTSSVSDGSAGTGSVSVPNKRLRSIPTNIFGWKQSL